MTPDRFNGQRRSALDTLVEPCALASAAVLLLGVVLFVVFVAWVQTSPATLGPYTVEDGPVENITALSFFIGGVGFLIAAARSRYLGARGSRWAYVMMIAWAAIAFVCCGEEISWGQRILDFGTPEQLKAANAQEEFTFHNLHAFASVGGTYRYLTIFILGTGLAIPLIGMTRLGRSLYDRFCFPVTPWIVAPAFVAAYLFGKYYIDISPVLQIKPANAINELRELMIGYAMALYGLTAASFRDLVFRPMIKSDS